VTQRLRVLRAKCLHRTSWVFSRERYNECSRLRSSSVMVWSMRGSPAATRLACVLHNGLLTPPSVVFLFQGLTSDLAHLEKRPIHASKPVPPVRGCRRVKGKSPVPLEKLSISAQTDFEWKKSRFL
jgi:hypothetical protein